MVDVVVHGVPCGREAGAGVVVLVDDVNHRDSGDGVHVVMVIGDGMGGFCDESAAVAEPFSNVPNVGMTNIGITKIIL